MKDILFLFGVILMLLIGSCSSEPQNSGSAGKNDEKGKQIDLANAGSAESLPVNLDGTGGPLDPPMGDIDDLNETSMVVTWANPANWFPANIPGPIVKLELSYKQDFEEILFSRDFVGENNASFVNLAPGATHFMRLSAYAPEGDKRFLPSKHNVIVFSTHSDSISEPSGIIIKPDFGSVSIEWPPPDSQDLFEYSLDFYEEEELATRIHSLLTKQNSVENLPLPSNKTYWLQFRILPVADNVKGLASLPFVTQFFVPGNQLESPENIAAEMVGEEVKVSWQSVTNNLGPMAYHLDVFTGEELNDLYGNFRLGETSREMEDSKAYASFSFELRAVPKAGNLKDMKSELVSLRFDLPTFSFTPPLVKALAPSPEDPTMLTATWEAPENANQNLRYEMEIAEDGNFSLDSAVDQRIEAAEITKGEFTGREPGKTYYFRIRAIGRERDASHLPSEWSNVLTFAIPAPPTPKPVEFNATDEKASLP